MVFKIVTNERLICQRTITRLYYYSATWPALAPCDKIAVNQHIQLDVLGDAFKSIFLHLLHSYAAVRKVKYQQELEKAWSM